MRKQFLWVLSLSPIIGIWAQNKNTKHLDTLSTRIDEVVVTGQFGNRSIKKSLYKVEVIDRMQIEKLGANNVADILNQTLNILIIPEKNSGNSKANIMGLGAGYTKILIDNIPLIGDEGFGSNIDLTKLNLDMVERIEIVKGSMGVEYGSNAMAGVINIITKKSQAKKWNIRCFIQEETVGKEYNWIDYGKGRHIQSLQIGHNVSSKVFGQIGVNRNDFQGFWGEMKGKNYFERDGMRGYEWQPKEQINPHLLLRFTDKKLQMMYKLDYMNEIVNVYSPVVDPERISATEWTYIARDRDYDTQRWVHHLGVNSQIFKKTKLSLDASYQSQKRMLTTKIFDIPQRNVLKEEPKQTYYEAKTWFSRGTIHNFLPTEKWDAQLGYEIDHTEGFAGSTTGSYAGSNLNKSILSGGIFTSAEFHLVDNWFVKPGFRYNFSNVFRAVPNISLVLKNTLNDRSEFRAVIGSSSRNPSFEELYTYFVDSNHDIQGNENLRPETSFSGSLFYTYSSSPGGSWHWSMDASTLYLQVQNQISLAVVNTAPLQYRFINLQQFESWLNSLSFKMKNNIISMNFGASILGRSQQIAGEKPLNYYYSPELNAGFSVEIPRMRSSVSVVYKGVGKSYDVMEDKSLGVTQYFFIEREPFHLLDASISQKLYKDNITLTLGARNILNVTNVQRGISSGGAHGNTMNSSLLFYGRSYFARLHFNF